MKNLRFSTIIFRNRELKNKNNLSYHSVIKKLAHSPTTGVTQGPNAFWQAAPRLTEAKCVYQSTPYICPLGCNMGCPVEITQVYLITTWHTSVKTTQSSIWAIQSLYRLYFYGSQLLHLKTQCTLSVNSSMTNMKLHKSFTSADLVILHLNMRSFKMSDLFEYSWWLNTFCPSVITTLNLASTDVGYSTKYTVITIQWRLPATDRTKLFVHPESNMSFQNWFKKQFEFFFTNVSLTLYAHCADLHQSIKHVRVFY